MNVSNENEEKKDEFSLTSLSQIYKDHFEYFNGLFDEDLQQKLNKGFKYSFGNFGSSDSTVDELKQRLDLLKPEWFTDKKVLDIGCADGTFTLTITLSYSPKLLIGVDIDNKLISRAIKSIHKVTNDLLAK